MLEKKETEQSGGMKKCNHCGEIKPINEFGRDKNRKDGLAYYCKSCHKKIAKEYYNGKGKETYKKYYERHREEIKKKQIEYLKKCYEEHPKEMRKKNRERFKKYYERHREEHIERCVKYRRSIKKERDEAIFQAYINYCENFFPEAYYPWANDDLAYAMETIEGAIYE